MEGLNRVIAGYAMRALGRRMLTKKELGNKMVVRFPESKEEEREAVISWCEKEKWLNDALYAEEYVRIYGVRKGARALQQALKRKGVSEEHIAKALERLDEKSGALAIAKLKLPSISAKNHLEKKAKLSRFLAGRGFSFGTISEVLDELL